jgi:hypothetical protein
MAKEREPDTEAKRGDNRSITDGPIPKYEPAYASEDLTFRFEVALTPPVPDDQRPKDSTLVPTSVGAITSPEPTP